ncbi:hypothetical protein E8E13_005792 [Curvularia kusanoi]|uniref:Uncharacterized protein n=1 Tax=Curvularia kusanoi TaxID=90978 RepID=A0A9P4T7X4_CURKU|nr:hypothetical protein E8E13_005792 [Curvularia kusanoi]
MNFIMEKQVVQSFGYKCLWWSRLMRQKVCMRTVRWDDGSVDYFCAKATIRGEAQSRSTAEVTWNPKDLIGLEYQDKDGEWLDCSNQTVQTEFLKRYRKLTLTWMEDNIPQRMEVDFTDFPMFNSCFIFF